MLTLVGSIIGGALAVYASPIAFVAQREAKSGYEWRRALKRGLGWPWLLIKGELS